jgi:hypothetical protein
MTMGTCRNPARGSHGASGGSSVELIGSLPSIVASFLLVVVLSCGCAIPAIREAGKQVTAGAVDQGLVALEDVRTRQRVAEVMASPEVQDAMRDIATGFTNGMIGAMTTDEALKRFTFLTKALAATATRAAVDMALSEITSTANQRRLEEMAETAATAATRAAMREMGADMAGMMAGGLGSEARGALASAAFEVARQAVLGSNQGMADLEQHKKKTGSLARLSGMLLEFSWLLPILLAVCIASSGAPPPSCETRNAFVKTAPTTSREWQTPFNTTFAFIALNGFRGRTDEVNAS